MDYNFKGIISVPAGALRAKKIFVASLFLLLALTLYDIFTYLALAADGRELGEVFSTHGLLPFARFSCETLISSILYYLGIIFSLMLLATGMVAIASFDFEELRGNPFLTARQALVLCAKKTRQLLLSLLAIAVFIGFIALLGVIVGLIARIPYIGELLYGLFFFFPNFVVSLFTVLIIFVFIMSILAMPASVAADRTGETFSAILETFLTIIRQPLRWIGYTAYSAAAAKVCAFIFAYFAFRAIQFLILTTRLGGGGKIDGIVASGTMHLPLKSGLVSFTTNIFPGLKFGFDMSTIAPAPGHDGIIGYIMAISLFLVFLIVWGYILSIITTGQAYAYAIIKKIRDDHAITEEKSLFLEEAWSGAPARDDGTETESNV
ncbi:MAG: hypothetical protein JSU69_05785 [Candidatus Zixiibacteriota bacterium]|nr:MAG: hypothetical protein JSU69_05785 [candidate division Zixibacteria bacterium]